MSVIFVSACAGIGLEECGDDKACLTAAFAQCTKAKGTIDVYGENHFYVEVRGLDGDKCIIYQRLEGPDVQKSLDRINELFDKSYKEFYIFCKIPRDVATQLSTDYSRIADYCNGPMVDQLKANTSSSNPD